MRASQTRLPGLPATPHSAHAQGLRSRLGAEAEKFVNDLKFPTKRCAASFVLGNAQPERNRGGPRRVWSCGQRAYSTGW